MLKHANSLSGFQENLAKNLHTDKFKSYSQAASDFRDQIQYLHLMGEELANNLQEGIEDDLNQLVLEQLNHSTSDRQRESSSLGADSNILSPSNFLLLASNSSSTVEQLEAGREQDAGEREQGDEGSTGGSPEAASSLEHSSQGPNTVEVLIFLCSHRFSPSLSSRDEGNVIMMSTNT